MPLNSLDDSSAIRWWHNSIEISRLKDHCTTQSEMKFSSHSLGVVDAEWVVISWSGCGGCWVRRQVQYLMTASFQETRQVEFKGHVLHNPWTWTNVKDQMARAEKEEQKRKENKETIVPSIWKLNGTAISGRRESASA